MDYEMNLVVKNRAKKFLGFTTLEGWLIFFFVYYRWFKKTNRFLPQPNNKSRHWWKHGALDIWRRITVIEQIKLKLPIKILGDLLTDPVLAWKPKIFDFIEAWLIIGGCRKAKSTLCFDKPTQIWTPPNVWIDHTILS